jgi:hypothetical protein
MKLTHFFRLKISPALLSFIATELGESSLMRKNNSISLENPSEIMPGYGAGATARVEESDSDDYIVNKKPTGERLERR